MTNEQERVSAIGKIMASHTDRRSALKAAAAAGLIPVLGSAVMAQRAAAQDATPKTGGTIVLLGQDSIESLSPEDTGETVQWVPISNMFEGLYTVNEMYELEPVLAEREGRLTLFDGRAEHFLVRDCRVAGLIDLHDVGPGDPAMDLAVVGLTDDLLIPEVLNGYLAEHEQDSNLRSVIPFYLLLRRLAGAEWQLRNGSTSVGRRLLRLAHRQVAEAP